MIDVAHLDSVITEAFETAFVRRPVATRCGQLHPVKNRNSPSQCLKRFSAVGGQVHLAHTSWFGLRRVVLEVLSHQAVSARIGRLVPLHIQLASSTLRKVIKRLRYPLEVMLLCVRWYAAYPLSLRNLEEVMAERGVIVDHATVHRWSLKILPVLAKVFRSRKRSVGSSWRMDETGSVAVARIGYVGRMTETPTKTMNDALSKIVKRLHHPLEVMLQCVRWYAAYPLSLRNLAGDDGRARRRSRRHDGSPVGGQDAAGAGPDASSAQAPGRVQLAHGRDLGQGRWPMEVSVPCGRQGWPDDRLPAARTPRLRRRALLLRARHRPARRAREDHHRQERRQRGGDPGHARRLGRRHRDAPIEVPQQPHRAGSPRRQAIDTPYAWIQELSLRSRLDRRHRDHAHDQEGPARRDQGSSLVFS